MFFPAVSTITATAQPAATAAEPAPRRPHRREGDMLALGRSEHALARERTYGAALVAAADQASTVEGG